MRTYCEKILYLALTRGLGYPIENYSEKMYNERLYCYVGTNILYEEPKKFRFLVAEKLHRMKVSFPAVGDNKKQGRVEMESIFLSHLDKWIDIERYFIYEVNDKNGKREETISYPPDKTEFEFYTKQLDAILETL